MKSPERILIIRTDRIGDTILATPLLRALRKTFPSAFIAAMVRSYTQDVLVNNPNIDKILLDDPRGEHRGVRGFWRQVMLLRQHQFDTALLLMPTARLAWMLFFAGIPTRVGVGSKPYEILTLMKRVSRNKYIPLRHETDYCLDLGRFVGASEGNLNVEIFPTDNEKRNGVEILHSKGIPAGSGKGLLIGIHPGNGLSAPNWRIERYAELVSFLLEREGANIVITGSKHETEFSPVLNAAGSKRVTDLIGTLSLRELTSVISCIDVLVSASTGPMHIAAALEVPTVSLFCPLPGCSPELWGPKGNTAIIVKPPESYCLKQCPGDPHTCNFDGGIEPEEVARNVFELSEQPTTAR